MPIIFDHGDQAGIRCERQNEGEVLKRCFETVPLALTLFCIFHRLLVGESTDGQPVSADRSNGMHFDAVVTNVLTDGMSGGFARHNLLIRHPEGIGLTRCGDSGLFWRLIDGTPLGMHFAGYEQVEGLSTVSASLLEQRLANRFAVQLVE